MQEGSLYSTIKEKSGEEISQQPIESVKIARRWDFSLNELSEALLCLEGMNFSCRMEITELSIIDFTENEREVIRFTI